MEKENSEKYNFKKNELSTTKQKQSRFEIFKIIMGGVIAIITGFLIIGGTINSQSKDRTPDRVYKNNDTVLYKLFNLSSDEKLADLEEKIFNDSMKNNDSIQFKIANDKMLVLNLGDTWSWDMKIQYVDLPTNSLIKLRNYSFTYYRLDKNAANKLEKELGQYRYPNVKLKTLKYQDDKESEFYNVSVVAEQKLVSIKEIEKVILPTRTSTELPVISESPNFPPISLEELDQIIKNNKFWDALPNPELISKTKSINPSAELSTNSYQRLSEINAPLRPIAPKEYLIPEQRIK